MRVRVATAITSVALAVLAPFYPPSFTLTAHRAPWNDLVIVRVYGALAAVAAGLVPAADGIRGHLSFLNKAVAPISAYPFSGAQRFKHALSV